MSIRCKICNALKIVDLKQIDSTVNWECKNCGAIFDFDGNYVTVG